MPSEKQFSAIEETEGLRALKESLAAHGARGLAIDIDETLCETNVWWFAELANKFGNPENLAPLEFEEKYKYGEKVPYWQAPEVYEWIHEKRHDDTVHGELPLIEGAPQALAEITKLFPIAAYISARPNVVRNGTARWLRKHGFPEAPIILAPLNVPFLERSGWKARILEYLSPEIAGIVDDHPLLPTSLSAEYPGTVFLYGGAEIPSETTIRVVACRDWPSVVAAVAAHVGSAIETGSDSGIQY